MRRMNMHKVKVKIELTEELLGTASNDPEIHETFVAKNAPDAPSRKEEVAALGTDAVVEKSKTVFPKLDDGTPFIWDYQIKGFFKDACGMLSRIKPKMEKGKKVGGSKSSQLTAYKKVIDGLIFPQPRKIPIKLPKGGVIGGCQRPLRAQTAQGERIALADSETVPAGSTLTFSVVLMDEKYEELLLEWLDYGCLRGIGQWRNSGKGRFSYEIQ
jgi:hypothetical protein